VFEPFVQLDRKLHAGHEGTGLGLAISRDLACAAKGDITVTSRPGKSSRFVISLARAGGPDAA
jgi:two-component system, sensor histidine kinase